MTQTMTINDPKRALDYPHIPDDKFIIVWYNDAKWPAANRKSSYMTNSKFHAIDDWALFTPFWEESAVFDNYSSAIEYFDLQQSKRKIPYNCKIMRVDHFKKERGYA